MVKKLTMKSWTNTGLLLLVCLGMAIAAFWYYGPSAIMVLQGGIPLLDEPLSNIYGMTALGLFMLVISLVIFIKMFTNSVSKRVNRYFERHPEVMMEQLDQAFESAEKIEKVWISERWTFSHELQSIVVENAEIVRAYSQKERAKKGYNYYLCLDLAEGQTEKKTERVNMNYYDIAKALELYSKYPNIRVENNV